MLHITPSFGNKKVSILSHPTTFLQNVQDNWANYTETGKRWMVQMVKNVVSVACNIKNCTTLNTLFPSVIQSNWVIQCCKTSVTIAVSFAFSSGSDWQVIFNTANTHSHWGDVDTKYGTTKLQIYSSNKHRVTVHRRLILHFTQYSSVYSSKVKHHSWTHWHTSKTK